MQESFCIDIEASKAVAALSIPMDGEAMMT